MATKKSVKKVAAPKPAPVRKVRPPKGLSVVVLPKGTKRVRLPKDRPAVVMSKPNGASKANPRSARVIASRKAKGLKHVHVFLEPKHQKRLAAIAKQLGKPHSEAIRAALDAYPKAA